MKKQKRFLKKIRFFFKSIALKFVEYLASIASDKIYLVSKEDINFSKNKVNKKGAYKYDKHILEEYKVKLKKPIKNKIASVGPAAASAIS